MVATNLSVLNGICFILLTNSISIIIIAIKFVSHILDLEDLNKGLKFQDFVFINMNNYIYQENSKEKIKKMYDEIDNQEI